MPAMHWLRCTTQSSPRRGDAMLSLWKTLNPRRGFLHEKMKAHKLSEFPCAYQLIHSEIGKVNSEEEFKPRSYQQCPLAFPQSVCGNTSRCPSSYAHHCLSRS
mmetsp:Transcript_61060/g.96921  ORF Transcript_61060/g.96921 Transcript_61060/m.96921 type:complete len:103 (-) Transcript_61060:1157-1465(-)